MLPESPPPPYTLSCSDELKPLGKLRKKTSTTLITHSNNRSPAMFNHLLCVCAVFFKFSRLKSVLHWNCAPPSLRSASYYAKRLHRWVTCLAPAYDHEHCTEGDVCAARFSARSSWGREPANKFVEHELHKCVCASRCMHADTHTHGPRPPECLRKRVDYSCWCYDIVLSFLFSNTVQTSGNCTA